MQIQDFNLPPIGPHAAPSPTETSAALLDPGALCSSLSIPETRERTEIALLKKRIEHLELVVETARSLMTSNQERLLRRLHDLPQELMALTSVLNRLGHDDAPLSDLCVQPSSTLVTARRVA